MPAADDHAADRSAGRVVRSLVNIDNIFIVDDSQRLGDKDLSLSLRLPIVVEQLQQTASNLRAPLLAIWPDLGEFRLRRGVTQSQAQM